MINDWIIRRCKLERLTWELPIESLRIRVRRLSGEKKKSAEPGRHNPTLAHYLSFHTRTKGPGSYWHSLDIFQLKCSVCGRAHICCVLLKRLSPPAGGGWPCVVSRRLQGKAVGRSYCLRGAPTEPSRPVGLTDARTKNLVSIANWLRVQGRFTRLRLSSELRGEKRGCRWSNHGEQSVSRWGGAGKEWEAAHQGSPDLRCSVSTRHWFQLFPALTIVSLTKADTRRKQVKLASYGWLVIQRLPP